MLVITGTLAYDYIMDFPGRFADHILPEQIHNINISFPVEKFAKRRGGTAGNVAYNLSLLKTKHILFSAAGKDFDEYAKEFRKHHISVEHVVIDSTKHTTTGFAMTDMSDNQIWGFFYGASEKMATLDVSTVTSKTDFVLVGPCGGPISIQFAKQCIDNNIPYMFDLGFVVTQLNKEELLLVTSGAKQIIGNDYEIHVLEEKIGDTSKLLEVKTVITTLGEKGAEISDKGKKYTIAVAKAKKVTDPTGAGDAWRAGFLAGYVKKLSIEDCGRLGSVVASFAVEEYGTQEHTFTLKDIQDRYTQTYDSLLQWEE